MATYIQSFKGGYIARESDKYQYVKGSEVVGTYATIDELVKAQEEDSGKQAKESKSSVSEEPATKPARKTKAKAKKPADK